MTQKDPAVLATTEPEALLLETIALGSRSSFAELYDRMMPRVLGLATRILRDSGHAEEVAQEVFIDVWQLASRFDASKGSAVGWILRRTHSRAVDRVRSSEAGRARDIKIGTREFHEPQPDVTEVVELRMDTERVERALAALPSTQREAIALAHLGGYSHSEVSEMLSVPIGTIKTRIRAGIGRLREELSAA